MAGLDDLDDQEWRQALQPARQAEQPPPPAHADRAVQAPGDQESQRARAVGRFHEAVQRTIDYVTASAFPQLTERLMTLRPQIQREAHTRVWWYDAPATSAERIPQWGTAMYALVLRWDQQLRPTGRGVDVAGSEKRIRILFNPNGTIQVRGGRRGSTELPLQHWLHNPTAQQKALERAYKHPLTEPLALHSVQ